MILRLMILLAAASIAATPALASQGNGKDFYKTQRLAPKHTTDVNATGSVAPLCKGQVCKHP